MNVNPNGKNPGLNLEIQHLEELNDSSDMRQATIQIGDFE